ncbi:MAG TPA: hypothetical protein VGM69_16985 [Chloroflexota bacterium]
MVEGLRLAALRLGRGLWSLFGLAGSATPELDRCNVERPWLISWHAVPKRSAGPGFGPSDYARARERAELIARTTLGEEGWDRLRREGHLDLRSRIFDGLTYRLRVGRRVQLLWDDPLQALRSPWPFEWLCINPTYPLPAAEFTAQLYLYLRDREEDVVRIGAPQPFDQALGRCF